MEKPIRVHKGKLYFPSRDAALAFAQHLGIQNPTVKGCLKGWSLQ